MESNEEIEYRNKLNICAQSLADQMAVLEARDRLMRLKRMRQTDLATAVAVVGTCPDMCPELERYFRQETNQVSIFEMDANSGRPDQHRMVKEYRRSGADQEEPLAHELRPTPVLNQTMDYLCTNIMDALDVNTSCGDWYDFVWSRTRSIRKDITQQHLCDQQVVSLTEKCARFHIHCSATLCEQNLKDFDPKINEENLSNCLQSLKDLYYDLSLRDIYCPNESEFRCYEILLHLNDTAILKDVQNYRQEIRDSKDVKIAIKAFFAFQSNNYIKFFKLLNQSSYLMSCILHRYFNQIRLKAFRILGKCYTFNSTSAQEYPSNSLLNYLGFEDYIELKLFCDQIGLESDHQIVYLIRGQNKSNSIKAKRSLRLVENKRNVSVGQVINGSSLPVNPYKSIPVHNSFDSEGKLKSDAIEAVDQKLKTNYDLESNDLKSKPFITSIASNVDIDKNSSLLVPNNSLSSKSIFPSKGKTPNFQISDNTYNTQNSKLFFNASETPLQLKTAFNPLISSKLSSNESQSQLNHIIEDLTEDVINGVIKDLLLEICSQQMQHILNVVFDQTICQIFSDIFLNTSDDMIREISLNVIQQEIQTNIENKKIIDELSNEIFDNLVDSQIKLISEEVFIKTSEECVEKKNEFISNILFIEIIDEIIKEICFDVHSNEREIRESMIRLMKEKRIKNLKIKYFNKWKNWFTKQKRLKHLTQSFPAAPKWHSSKSAPNLLEFNFSDQSFDQSFRQSIEREQLANNWLNFFINKVIKEIITEVFESSVIENSEVYQYFKQKRIKRIQTKYFQKWRLFCAKSRLNLKRMSFPAAPNLRTNVNPIRNKTKYIFSDINPEINICSKRQRLEVIPNANILSSNLDSNVKPLFETELNESKALTEKLRQDLNENKINTCNQTTVDLNYLNLSENEEQSDEENPEIATIEVFETEIDKINRLKRLLSEEKDYFSLQNFIQYLNNNQ